MTPSEALLFPVARALYRTEVAHSSEMKEALQDASAYDAYRSAETAHILPALERFGLSLFGKTVVDFGCNYGALSAAYLRHGAARVIGLDVDAVALQRARMVQTDSRLEFRRSDVDAVPLDDASVDLILSYDVFEHVSQPDTIVRELYRALTPGGRVLIGTWSWHHPFAPHLWAVMPVPWAHLLVSEKTLLRVSRRVYEAPWYRPNMFDVDEEGRRIADKYTHTEISRDYLNKYLIRDFERVFHDAGFAYETHPQPFGSAQWMRPLLTVGWLRELLSSYVWFVLTKPHQE